jgi:hypothetical protein
VRVDEVNDIAPEKSGKFRYVTSRVSPGVAGNSHA